jgi:hypothetical protein|tara:strand:- start:3452 stop:3982 length:531 start_codon:yes stop_codon:yes gene_type:complete
MSTLTESQKNVIKVLKDEFKQMNSKKNVVNDSIIDSLFNEANQYVIERDEFYYLIESNNSLITKKRIELVEMAYKKVCELFKNYSDIVVSRDENGIYFGYICNSKNEKPNYKSGYCAIFGVEYIAEHSVRFDDKSTSKKITKRKECGLQMNSSPINLEDFETSEIFKIEVLGMLTT